MPSNPTHLYVADEASLSVLVNRLKGNPRVAIDTEADSLHHYFEKVCLIQISIAHDHFIVDPLAGLDLAPLMAALSKCVLLLHGADYDLRMLRRDFGFHSVEVFDTMIAAQLLGYEKFGLAALVERVHGVVLNKHGQKADWSRRPLPPDLLEYARNDTVYLQTVADRLRDELHESGRLQWHQEVCRRLLLTIDHAAGNGVDLEKQWRIKGWHSLKSRRAQAILRELWLWRDDEAKRSDVPPFRVLGNEPLIQLSQWAVEDKSFSELPRLPRNCLGRRLRALKAAIVKGRNCPENELPRPLPALRHEHVPDMEHLINALRAIRDENANKLAIDPGVLMPTNLMTIIARGRPKDPTALRAIEELYDWQADLLGEQIIAAVREVLNGHFPKPATKTKSSSPANPPAA